MGRLRIAVIGVGVNSSSRAREYLRTLTRLRDHYEVVAICDRGRTSLNEAGEIYGVKARHTSIQSLLDSESPDVVLSMTPKDSHVVIALTAARRGIHVITEIPVALTRRYARSIAEACRTQGVLWEVAEQVPFWPQERLKRRVIENGLLGEVTHARLWYLTGQYHGFAGVRALLGSRPTRVLGYCGEVARRPYIAYGGESESTAQWDHAVVEFESGVSCLFEKPPRAFPLPTEEGFSVGWQVEGTEGYWDRSRLVLYGDGKANQIDLAEEFTEVNGERLLQTVRVATEPPVEWKNPYISYGIGAQDDVAKASILVSFHEAISQGKSPQYGHENGLIDWEFCLAVRESHRLGNTWVDLPMDDKPTQLETQLEEAFVQRYGHDPIEDTETLLDTEFTKAARLWPFTHWL